MAQELALSLDAVSHTAAQAAFSMDEEGFRQFYSTTARSLRAYLFRVVGNPTIADDLHQESYFRLLRAKLPEMDDKGRKNYLFRIATNLAHDHFRRSKRAEKPLPEIPVSERTGDINLRADMSKALQKLKPRERELLWLAYVEGSTHAEIADTVGVKQASIKMLLFRARQNLATVLREKGFDPKTSMKVRP
jgi:RNA polymerase sigma-70 factor (ECF subfamily)